MRSFVSLLLISFIPTAALLATDTAVVATPVVTTPVVNSEVQPAHREDADPPPPSDVLTNEGIVQLSNAGFSDSFIVQKILLSRTRLDTTVDGLTLLRRNSVSERLIEYILRHEAQPMPTAASPSPQAAPPALIRMKVVKTKLLVPASDASAGSGLFHRAPFYALYPPSQSSPWPFSIEPAYALPPHPLLQSPAFPAAGVPVLTPAETRSLWLPAR
jgi:hypothetical protein